MKSSETIETRSYGSQYIFKLTEALINSVEWNVCKGRITENHWNYLKTTIRFFFVFWLCAFFFFCLANSTILNMSESNAENRIITHQRKTKYVRNGWRNWSLRIHVNLEFAMRYKELQLTDHLNASQHCNSCRNAIKIRNTIKFQQNKHTYCNVCTLCFRVLRLCEI